MTARVYEEESVSVSVMWWSMTLTVRLWISPIVFRIRYQRLLSNVPCSNSQLVC